MLESLLVFAGVNLALGVAVMLPSLVRRKWMSRRLALASVPVLWALAMVGVYLYLRAMMPPSPVIVGLDARRTLRHGNVAWIVWDEHVSTASFQAFCLTVATLLSVITLWLTYTIRARRKRARF